MALSGSDIKRFRATTNDDTGSNGGRMTAVEVADITGILWPSAADAERAAGSTKYRKLFHANHNADDEAAYNVRFVLDEPTTGDDALYLFPGTATDTQSGISSPDLFGAGLLDAGVLVNDTEIDVAVEDGAVIIFRDTEQIRIKDGAAEEWATISGTPSVVGDIVTITLAAGLANAWSSGAQVSSAIEVSDLTPTVTNKVVTSAAGTFDETDITLDNKGTIYDTWTLTFSDATNFSAAGSFKGAVGSGVIGSTFAPNNADYSQPYFSIPAAAWGGTFANGDTVVFVTHPAAAGIWEKRVIPAGAASKKDNTRTIVAYFEGA